MSQLKLSILIPTYNGVKTIQETLGSILSQSFSDFEIILTDDASTDQTEEAVKSLGDPRIKFFRNLENVGYPKNLERARLSASGDILYLMGQDDILGHDALLNTFEAFLNHPEIGAVTRPYFWFDTDIKKPVRAKNQLNPKKNEAVKITDDPKKIIRVFETLDQFSGLAYRRDLMTPFHEDIFPCHVYPFARIFKNHPVFFLKNYNVAVRIRSSQSRTKSSVYDKSPIESWAEMIESVFSEAEHKKIKNYLIQNFVARNYVGLAQIKNYSTWKNLFWEIWMLIRYRHKNLFSLRFWFFSLGSIIVPSFVLIPFIDWYKNNLNSRRFKNITLLM